MSGRAFKLKVMEATQKLNKQKGKGSKSLNAMLTPEAILSVRGNEKMGK